MADAFIVAVLVEWYLMMVIVVVSMVCGIGIVILRLLVHSPSGLAHGHGSLADARCCIFCSWSFTWMRAGKASVEAASRQTLSLTRFLQARETPVTSNPNSCRRKPPRSVERAIVNSICKEDAASLHQFIASGRSLRCVRARVLLLSARHSGLSVRMATPAADLMHPCLPLPRASAGRRLRRWSCSAPDRNHHP